MQLATNSVVAIEDCAFSFNLHSYLLCARQILTLYTVYLHSMVSGTPRR